MIRQLRRRADCQFFVELARADRRLAAAWWTLLALRGALPAIFAVLSGALVGAVQQDSGVMGAVAALGVLFIVLQIISPLQAQVGANLGERLTGRLNDRLLASTISPSGLGHLESPDLIDDLTAARDFELGMSGPPMPLALGFIASGLVEFIAGFSQLVVLSFYAWWAPLVVGSAWLATHWLLPSSTVWDLQTGEVLAAQRRAEYAYRLAMDTPAAKEMRLFGLSDWVVARFARARHRLVDIRWRAARVSRLQIAAAMVVVVGANVVCVLALARAAASGALDLAASITFVQAIVGASAIAFGGFNWAMPHAAHAVSTVRRLDSAMAERGRLPEGRDSVAGQPRAELRFRDVRFAYTAGAPEVLKGLNLAIPVGGSTAIVGVNGAGKTTLVKLLCRLYDPTSGSIEVDGIDLRSFDVSSWRDRLSVIFQDYIRYELPLRDNVAPHGGSDEDIRDVLGEAGVGRAADLGTVLSAGYDGGVDLSGGQWQRVALARVLHDVRQGAGVVILDEPTAQLDVRGEAQVFERLLEATRGCTTILISHRFSTMRLVDQICVLEGGRVMETGSHEELMALGGRYRTMFDLQASRFGQEQV